MVVDWRKIRCIPVNERVFRKPTHELLKTQLIRHALNPLKGSSICYIPPTIDEDFHRKFLLNSTFLTLEEKVVKFPFLILIFPQISGENSTLKKRNCLPLKELMVFSTCQCILSVEQYDNGHR